MEDISKFSFQNRLELANDSVCGCYHCLKIFHPEEIEEWIDDSPETAVCPFCHIDSIIGEGSGFPITKEFLKKIKSQMF